MQALSYLAQKVKGSTLTTIRVLVISAAHTVAQPPTPSKIFQTFGRLKFLGQDVANTETASFETNARHRLLRWLSESGIVREQRSA